MSNYLIIFILWSRERGKLILRNYFPLTDFTKRFIVNVWHRRCLNKPWVLNMPDFSVYRGSEYVFGFEYVRVLDILQLLVCQIYTGFWIRLIMPECARICLNGFCFTFTPCNSLSKGIIVRFIGKWKFDFFSILAGRIWFFKNLLGWLL